MRGGKEGAVESHSWVGGSRESDNLESGIEDTTILTHKVKEASSPLLHIEY